MTRGLFFTEASQQVGFGHLMECLAVAAEARRDSECYFHLSSSSSAAVQLVVKAGNQITDFEAFRGQYDWILLNTRKNSLELQEKLCQYTNRLVVLDELGGISLGCQALINFSCVGAWHQYPSCLPGTESFLGPDFFPVRQSLLSPENTKNGGFLLCLGGSDRTRSTLRVAEALSGLDVPGTYVLGPGCDLSVDDVKAIDGNHDVVKAPDNLDVLLQNCSVLICAGGNMTYEANYLGKKVLTVWEDEHERVQSETLVGMGRATIVGSPTHIDRELLRKAVMEEETPIESPPMVDGRGAKRVHAICRGTYGK